MIVKLKLLLQQVNVVLPVEAFFPHGYRWITGVAGHRFVVPPYQFLKLFGLHVAKIYA